MQPKLLFKQAAQSNISTRNPGRLLRRRPVSCHRPGHDNILVISRGLS
jgi:hypothetical protein